MTDAASLNGAPAILERSDRVRIRFRGPDRLKTWNNLSTQNLKTLLPGKGAEGFITSLKGKTQGYVTFHQFEETLLLRTDPGGYEHVQPLYDKYAIFDETEPEPLEGRSREWHLFGPKLAEWYPELAPVFALPELGGMQAEWRGAHALAIKESPTGWPGVTLIAIDDAVAGLADQVERQVASGLTRVSEDAFEAFRIAAGTPRFGRDVTPDNLPQELDRDRKAISFTKGCYIGQETVARLDARGHVNKLLRGLRFASETPPPPGSSLRLGDRAVGTITSSALAPDGSGSIGLAILRVEAAEPGTELDVLETEAPSPLSTATVEGLPMFHADT